MRFQLYNFNEYQSETSHNMLIQQCINSICVYLVLPRWVQMRVSQMEVWRRREPHLYLLPSHQNQTDQNTNNIALLVTTPKKKIHFQQFSQKFHSHKLYKFSFYISYLLQSFYSCICDNIPHGFLALSRRGSVK